MTLHESRGSTTVLDKLCAVSHHLVWWDFSLLCIRMQLPVACLVLPFHLGTIPLPLTCGIFLVRCCSAFHCSHQLRRVCLLLQSLLWDDFLLLELNSSSAHNKYSSSIFNVYCQLQVTASGWILKEFNFILDGADPLEE